MADTPKNLVTPGELLDAGFVTFETIPHPMRAWSVVGCYIGYFSLLERAAADALALLLDLDVLAGEIVGRNMGAIEKIRAVRTLINVAMGSLSDSSRLNDTLRRAQKVAEERNIVAHTVYGPSSTSDGIEFYTVHAKGTFKSSVLDWSIALCDQKIDELRQIGDDLASEDTKALLKRARMAIKGQQSSLADLLAALGGDT